MFLKPKGASIFQSARASGVAKSVGRLLRYVLRALHNQTKRLILRGGAVNSIETICECSRCLEIYHDVAKAGISPLQHYLQFGAAEGHDPSLLFQARWYLETYPDVAKAGINPLQHYL
jgi:hypothetical protein